MSRREILVLQDHTSKKTGLLGMSRYLSTRWGLPFLVLGTFVSSPLLTEQEPVDVWVGSTPRWVDGGDLDGDGDIDLVTIHQRPGSVSVLWNTPSEAGDPPPEMHCDIVEFRRGDVDADGRLNLTDAVALLGHLFQGADGPTCTKTADATDDGALNLTDVVAYSPSRAYPRF